MKRLAQRLRAISAAIVALSLASASTSLADTPTPASGATWGANQHVPYRWKATAVPPDWLKPAIRAAARDSNASRAAKAAVFSYDSDALSWIGYTPDIPTNYAVGYAVRHVPDSFNIRLRPHGHVLDWGKLRWCQFYETWPDGCYDAELITLHEFGHVQTLGHVDESLGEAWLDSIMHAGPRTKAKIGWNEDQFGRCDVARLQIRYRALTPTTRYSTCLSLATSVTFAASSTSVSYQGKVVFSAGLRVSDDAPYAKLAGEALSNRTVVLQRRLPGASSWTDHATMAQTSTPGRYTASAWPTTTYEWRALFRRPDAEGLKRSSSTIVKVSVSKCENETCCSGSICATETAPGESEE